jgi:hypothetical protein
MGDVSFAAKAMGIINRKPAMSAVKFSGLVFLKGRRIETTALVWRKRQAILRKWFHITPFFFRDFGNAPFTPA